jgi:FkbM family methyltransferase
MLIYDVGMHNGDDTAYYLTKGAKVVAIEANPDLCSLAEARFASEIRKGFVTILNCAVSDKEGGEIDFFINEGSTVESSLYARNHAGLRKISVSARRLSDIVKEYGRPDFAKIDVEKYDQVILRDLRLADCVPDHFSVEAHHFDVIKELLMTDHSKFRLVRGNTIGRRFAQHGIKTPLGMQNYSFPNHSSGPFGEDLPEAWVSAEAMVTSWLVRGSLYGHGWYDIHAMK